MTRRSTDLKHKARLAWGLLAFRYRSLKQVGCNTGRVNLHTRTADVSHAKLRIAPALAPVMIVTLSLSSPSCYRARGRKAPSNAVHVPRYSVDTGARKGDVALLWGRSVASTRGYCCTLTLGDTLGGHRQLLPCLCFGYGFASAGRTFNNYPTTTTRISSSAFP